MAFIPPVNQTPESAIVRQAEDYKKKRKWRGKEEKKKRNALTMPNCAARQAKQSKKNSDTSFLIRLIPILTSLRKDGL